MNPLSPDDARRVVIQVGLLMARDVEAAGQRFRIVVLPSRYGLEYRASEGVTPWAGILEAWQVAGVEVLDLTPNLVAGGAGRSDACWMPGGHYSPMTNMVVAQAMRAAIAP